MIITIIINVTVCDHHDHYPPAAALSRGQNKDLWLEGGDAETMFQPFGIFLGRYVTMQIQRWKGVRMDSNEQMQKGWTYVFGRLKSRFLEIWLYGLQHFWSWKNLGWWRMMHNLSPFVRRIYRGKLSRGAIPYIGSLMHHLFLSTYHLSQVQVLLIYRLEISQ